MPYAPHHKQQTRERIVRSARRLFNRRGFTEVSIDEVMAEVGLTRGGFYSHFRTKEELYAEAITFILVDHPAQNWEGVEFDVNGPALARTIVNAYLSDQHFEDVSQSCPLIALPSDVARAGDKVKAAYRQVLESMVGIFAARLAQDGNGHEAALARQRALSVAALCIGGMVLARGIDDAAFGREIREAARMLALEAGGWADA